MLSASSTVKDFQVLTAPNSPADDQMVETMKRSQQETDVGFFYDFLDQDKTCSVVYKFFRVFPRLPNIAYEFQFDSILFL